MKKSNHFTTQTNKLSITLHEYSLLKKYIGTHAGIIQAYETLITTKTNIHRQLVSENLQNIYLKETLLSNIFNKIQAPFKDVALTDLHITNSGDNLKKGKEVIKHIDNLIGKGYIINAYSDVGEQSAMFATYLTELLIKNQKGKTITGLTINSKSVDFNDTNAINDFLSADFLTIFNIQSVFVTDFRQNFLDNLYTQAKLDRKPLIISSKTEMKSKEYKVINIKLTEKYKNEMELIEMLSDKVPEINKKLHTN